MNSFKLYWCSKQPRFICHATDHAKSQFFISWVSQKPWMWRWEHAVASAKQTPQAWVRIVFQISSSKSHLF